MKRADWLPEIAREAVDVNSDVWAEAPTEGTPRYAASRGVLMLLEAISAKNRITVTELMAGKKNRTWAASFARREAYYELHKLKFSWKEAARIMGVTHWSVLEGARRHAESKGEKL